jgi:arylsulfatase A-like enzyme
LIKWAYILINIEKAYSYNSINFFKTMFCINFYPRTWRTGSKLLSAILFLAFMSCKSKTDSKVFKRPNIVVILADDLGYGDARVYNDQSKIPTPNIDALAENGLRFTDAHSPSSVCTPTRYGLLTGRYAWRTELKKSVLWAWDRPLIEQDRETIPKMLKRIGYQTACIGKWHLGWRWPSKSKGFINDTIAIGDYGLKGRNDLWKKIDFTKPLAGGPLAAGFDYYFGDDVPNFPPYTFIENNKLVAMPDSLKPDTVYGGPGPMAEGWDLTQVMPHITYKSVEYIERQASSDQPFFLYFALTAPHTPIAPTAQFVGKSKAGRYGDYVFEVDWALGQLVDALRRSGQLENTILVFTSDNGSPQRDGTNMGGDVGTVKKYDHDPSRPFRGIKADIYEGGHRVPFIISWPNTIDRGRVTDQLFGLTDLSATLSGILEIPESDRNFADSMDFGKVLTGEGTEPVRKDIVHHSIDGTFSIRRGPWKLIVGQGSGGWSKTVEIEGGNVVPQGQLYNLKEDHGEQKNLYEQYPEIVTELTARLNLYKDQGYSNH